ncbi:MAG: ATP-binding protein [Gemmatimonadaceae bacterium]|nr:ATP-binding protein [Gemmatimonadaceae bacterium]
MIGLPPSAPLSRRDAIQQALSRAAERMLLGDLRWEGSLSELLVDLGEATDVSRVFVFQHEAVDGATRGTVVAQWTAPGIAAARSTASDTYEALGLAAWLVPLAAGEPIAMTREIAPPGPRAFLVSRGILSIVVVPIRVDGTLWGVIGFDECSTPREPSMLEVDALLSAARLIGAAIHRRALEERLAEQSRALRNSELLHRTLIRHFPNGSVSLVDRDLRFVLIDGAGFREYGIDPATMVGFTLRECLPPELAAQDEPLYLSALRGHEAAERVSWEGKTFDMHVVPVRDEAGTVTHAMALITDVTAQIAAEAALREHQAHAMRTQKIEALGRLAGGIAHDFNNLLTVIGTSAELAIETIPPAHDATTDLQQIRRAAERGYLLTRQLLSFTRQQPAYDEKLVSLNDVVLGALGMLERVSGAARPLDLDLAPRAGAVLVDRGQLEQVLVNLVVNALDATADGGTVTVSTARTPGALYGFETPEALLLTVKDTGIGMDEATREKIFEPFFTTKGPGRGTGLGLATVFAIVERSGGRIHVESAPGEGTAMTVALPRRGEEVDPPSEALMETPARGHAETVLVVDDETGVRASVRRLLVANGYRVIEAKHGLDALLELERHRSSIALVLTDVVMPELDGPGLVDRLRVQAPGLPVVYMSGYASDLLTATARVQAEAPLIEKPFSSRELLRVVRTSIDRTAA